MMDGWEQLPLLYLGFAVVIGAILIGGAWIIVRAVRSTRPAEPSAPTFIAPVRTTSTAATTAIPVIGSAPPLSAEVTAEIDRLVASEQRIAAIKVLRDATGSSLQEAKDRIDRWAPGTVPVSSTPPRAMPTDGASIRTTLPAPVATEIDRLVAAEQKIAAIKLLREHAGLGLRESKDLIESWAPGRP